jgi:renalase
MTETEVLIIGAGLSGLILANKLKKPSIIIEKSRGVGGRIATRRINDQGLDHGALYFPNDPYVINLLDEYSLNQSMKISEKGLYLQSGMITFPKKLAQDLIIHKSEKATKIERNGSKWIVKTDLEKSYTAHQLIITAPLPQALELLNNNDILFPLELNDVQYSKAVIALFICHTSPTPGNLSHDLHSIERMDLRGLHQQGYVVRANEETSEKIFSLPDEEILSCLEEKFLESFSSPPSIQVKDLKKWKYVLPYKALPYPFLQVENNLYLIGDSFLANDMRGALKSAEELSKVINGDV